MKANGGRGIEGQKDGRTDGHLENPFVLQDIGHLGPLPIKGQSDSF